MKAYSLFELKLFIKNPKNKMMFLVFSAFLLLTVSMNLFRGTGNIERIQYHELNMTRIAISTLSAAVEEDPEQSEFYDSLYDQQQLVAAQDVAIRFEEDSWYTEAGLNLAQLQLEMHDSVSLEDLGQEIQTIVPTVHQAESSIAFLTSIEETSIPLMRDREHAAGFLITFFDYFSVSAFVFLLLFSFTIISSDFDHPTMVKGYPVTYENKTASKVLLYTLASFLTIAGLTILASVITAIFTTTGPLNYPQVLYQNGGYQGVPLISYGWRYARYILVLCVHVTTLSAFLNTVTKNSYATLFSGLFFFFVPVLFQNDSDLWRWLPFHYYRPHDLFSGQTAYNIGQPLMTYSLGLIILLLYSLIFIAGIAVYRQSSQGNSVLKSKSLKEETHA